MNDEKTSETLGDVVELEGAKSPRRLILILTVATSVLSASVLGLGIWTSATGQTNRGVLCALKADHERDIKNSTQFLEDNPKGIPGIPARLIEQGIADDKTTLEAFDGLDCSSGL